MLTTIVQTIPLTGMIGCLCEQPAAILLPKKEAVLPAVVKGIEDKVKGVLPVLAAAAPHPPMPVSGAVSGAPVATSGAPAVSPTFLLGPFPRLVFRCFIACRLAFVAWPLHVGLGS